MRRTTFFFQSLLAQVVQSQFCLQILTQYRTKATLKYDNSDLSQSLVSKAALMHILLLCKYINFATYCLYFTYFYICIDTCKISYFPAFIDDFIFRALLL